MVERLLFLGDSVAAEPAMSFVPMALAACSATMDVAEAVNSSVPSSNVFDVLDRTQELLPLRTEAFTTAVIFVGINDSKIFARFDEPLVPLDMFKRRLSMLSERLEAAGIRVVLCGLPDLNLDRVKAGGHLDDFWYWLPHEYRRYDEVIREVAGAQDRRLYVDLDAAFASAPGDRDDLFGPDGVHPSLRGQMIIGSAIAHGLTSAAGDSPRSPADA